MVDKRDVHTTIPPDRFDLSTHFDPGGQIENTTQTPFMNYIDGPGSFDAGFFNISPKEVWRPHHMSHVMQSCRLLRQNKWTLCIALLSLPPTRLLRCLDTPLIGRGRLPPLESELIMAKRAMTGVNSMQARISEHMPFPVASEASQTVGSTTSSSSAGPALTWILPACISQVIDYSLAHVHIQATVVSPL